MSNARALELNRSVRGRLWDDEQTSLQVSDVLLVNQNSIKDELYNGDLVTVVEVRDKPEVRKVAIKGVSDPVQLFFRQASVGYLTSEGSVRRIHCLLLENLLDLITGLKICELDIFTRGACRATAHSAT